MIIHDGKIFYSILGLLTTYFQEIRICNTSVTVCFEKSENPYRYEPTFFALHARDRVSMNPRVDLRLYRNYR